MAKAECRLLGGPPASVVQPPTCVLRNYLPQGKGSIPIQYINRWHLHLKKKGKVVYGQEPPSGESTIPQNVGSIINYLQ